MDHWIALDRLTDVLVGYNWKERAIAALGVGGLITLKSADDKYSIEINCNTKQTQFKSADLKWNAVPLVDDGDVMQIRQIGFTQGVMDTYDLLQGNIFDNIQQKDKEMNVRGLKFDGRLATVFFGPECVKVRDLKALQIVEYYFVFEINGEPEVRNSASVQKLHIQTENGIQFLLIFSQYNLHMCNMAGILVTTTAINNDDAIDKAKIQRTPMDVFGTLKRNTHSFKIEENNLIAHQGVFGRIKMAFPHIPYLEITQSYQDYNITVSEKDKNIMYCFHGARKYQLQSGFMTNNILHDKSTGYGTFYQEAEYTSKVMYTASELANMFYNSIKMRQAVFEKQLDIDDVLKLVLNYTTRGKYVDRYHLTFAPA